MELNFVEQQVSLLTKEWYEEKITNFKKLPYYNKKTGRVYCKIQVIDDSDPDEKTNLDMITDEDIFSYSWDNHFDEAFKGSSQYNDQLPFDSIKIADRIIVWINRTNDGVDENSVKYKVILQVLETVKRRIEILIQQNKGDEKYISVIDDFFVRFENKIKTQYEKEINAHLISTEYSNNEGLKFDLNQDELASLMYILYRAQILYRSTEGDTSFLYFCEKYFYFPNQKAKTFTAKSGDIDHLKPV